MAIPCNAILSDADRKKWEDTVHEAMDSDEGLDAIVGEELTNQDQIRMVPDILQNGDNFFFPVFSTAEAMGEYGDNFSKLEKHFLAAVSLARNNEKNVKGIVLNAFSTPVVINLELFELVESMESGLKE